MSTDDDLAQKVDQSSKPVDLQSSTSGIAMRVAQGEIAQTPDIKKQVTDAYEDAAKRIGQAVHHDKPHTASADDHSRELAQSGYTAFGQQVASTPLASIAIAAFFGVALGWAFRGASERRRRNDILAALTDYRRRVGQNNTAR